MEENNREKILSAIKEELKEEEESRETGLSLSAPTFDEEEIMEAIDSLVSTWVTMGDKVELFEEKWSEYLGAEHSVMVNSGSSANLLALKCLAGDEIKEGDEVIVPAVSWSTTVFPIVDINAKPVIVDVNKEDYTIDVEEIRKAINKDTAAIMPVHLLGNPAKMDEIMEIAEEEDLAVVEDCCEAHGAEYNGKKVGGFGDLGTFSFFFSHHISTIEGGMINTNSNKYAEKLKMLRAHGWVRELEDKEKYVEQNPDIDERFLFQSQGYNLRPTEISGAFGMHQVDKLEGFISKRRNNAEYLNEQLEEFSEYFRLLEERENTRCSWFAYPIMVKESAPFSKKDLQKHLEENNIETRPILAGNIAKQPALENISHKVIGDLEDANLIHNKGMFIGNHHKLNQEKLDYIIETIRTFIEEQRQIE